MANLSDSINKKEEHEFSLTSNNFLRPPLKQIGNSIFDITKYFCLDDGINVAPKELQPPLPEIKDTLIKVLENSKFLQTQNIITGTVIQQGEESRGFVFMSESLGLVLNFPVVQRQSLIKCDVLIALPHQPVMIFAITDGDRESKAARKYNTHAVTEVTKTLRKYIDESLHVIGGVLSLADLRNANSFRQQVEKFARISSFFVTKRSFSMNLSKFEKISTAFWAGVAETKSILVGGKVDKDYLRFLTKEQCIVLVEI